MKLFAVLATAAVLTAPVLAAPCRDAKGHFAKCPPAGASGAVASKGGVSAAMPAGVTKDAKGRCHGSGGKYVACPK